MEQRLICVSPTTLSVSYSPSWSGVMHLSAWWQAHYCSLLTVCHTSLQKKWHLKLIVCKWLIFRMNYTSLLFYASVSTVLICEN